MRTCARSVTCNRPFRCLVSPIVTMDGNIWTLVSPEACTGCWCDGGTWGNVASSLRWILTVASFTMSAADPWTVVFTACRSACRQWDRVRPSETFGSSLTVRQTPCERLRDEKVLREIWCTCLIPWCRAEIFSSPVTSWRNRLCCSSSSCHEGTPECLRINISRILIIYIYIYILKLYYILNNSTSHCLRQKHFKCRH